MRPSRTWMFAAVLVAPLIGGGPPGGDTADRAAPGAEPHGAALAEPFAAPPEMRHPGDPADTLYQTARAALSRGDYRRAAELFGRIVNEEPASEYAPDALYWRAFSLYRVGGIDALGLALEALDLQAERFPEAATRGDARALRARIQGELASRGDAEAAESVVSVAEGRAIGAAARARAAESRARAARGIRSVEDDVEDDCPDEESDMRTAALHALMRMDADRALPILEKVLERRDECSEVLRERAVFIIAESESERAQEILLRVARTDPHPGVRERAVFWLSEVDDPRAVDALEQILNESDDPRLRERALFALANQESERAGAILRRFAEDASVPEELRERAIFWLVEHGDPANVAFLKALFDRVSEPALMDRILFAVAESDDPGATDWLVEISRDASLSSEIRGRALFWAAESGDEAAYALLLGLWDGTDDPEIKRQLLFAYSEMETDAAFDKLVEIARDPDEDPEVRKRALLWLGESDDPRVLDLLEEMVTQ